MAWRACSPHSTASAALSKVSRVSSPAPRQSGDEDRLLVRKESEEIRLCDAGPLGDRRGGGPAVPGDRELGDRSANDALAPLLHADPAHWPCPCNQPPGGLTRRPYPEAAQVREGPAPDRRRGRCPLDRPPMDARGAVAGAIRPAHGNEGAAARSRRSARVPPLPVGRADQRRPAKRSLSGRAAPVVSWTRTNVSMPMNSPNLSLPIPRKKMFSPWLACAASASNF